MNPLMGMMGNTGVNDPMSAISQAMQVINQIKQFGNPQVAMNILAQQNPNIKKAMDTCRGRNPQQVFEQMCRQNGMDLGQIAKMIK